MDYDEHPTVIVVVEDTLGRVQRQLANDVEWWGRFFLLFWLVGFPLFLLFGWLTG